MADEKVVQGSTEETRQQMSETRASLAEKLDTLEKQVGETVQDATQTVATVKETVQDTVESVKETVHDTVASVKETVNDTVETVRDFLDIKAHVERNPWIMMAGGAVIGFLSGRLLHAQHEEPASSDSTVQEDHFGRRHHNGRGRRHEGKPREQAAQGLASQFGPEMNKLKSLALGTVFGLLRDWLEPRIPDALKTQASEILSGITNKLGADMPSGTIMEGGDDAKRRDPSRPGESRFSDQRSVSDGL